LSWSKFRGYLAILYDSSFTLHRLPALTKHKIVRAYNRLPSFKCVYGRWGGNNIVNKFSLKNREYNEDIGEHLWTVLEKLLLDLLYRRK
jgi:hypothetical protein